MYSGHIDKTVRAEIEPVLRGMGFALVDLAIGRLKGSTRITIVVYRREGVGIEECGQISRLIHPRLETIEGLGDVSLEVGSPGIERTLKRPEEYVIFLGRGVRILSEGHAEWAAGVIEQVADGKLTLRVNGRSTEYPLASIRKARLDHTVETRTDAAGDGARQGK